FQAEDGIRDKLVTGVQTCALPISAPFLRVTVGSPIYTADDEKIGKVKEVRDQHFKVETGLLQRDYWLHADCVAQATPDDSVILKIGRASCRERVEISGVEESGQRK